MFDVMDKYNQNWGYRRVDMRIYITPLIKVSHGIIALKDF
jgi:hypothetical protein